MRCPSCGGDSHVSDSRVAGTTIRRRRRCLACDARWFTVETPEARTTGAPDRVPEAHRVVQFLFEEKARRRLSLDALSAASRVSVRTIGKWRTCRIPRVDTVDQVLLPLGYELWVRRVAQKSEAPATGRGSLEPE